MRATHPSLFPIEMQRVFVHPHAWRTTANRSGRLARSFFFSGGALQTSDVIIESGGRASEQLTVVEGTGIYRGATGGAVILKNPIERWAPFRGEVCLPF
jgi:hypothetical protein